MCEAGVCDIESEDIENDNLNVNPIRDKAKSAPIDTLPSEDLLKVQISAPSYFHSLKENQAPPFRKPEKERRPCLLLDNFVTENDVVEMVAAADDEHSFKKHLCKYLVNKNAVDNYNIFERDFLMSLLIECMDYAAQRKFSAFKLACLFTVYLTTHLYFKFYYWLPPRAVWAFFKEIMIRHTIEAITSKNTPCVASPVFENIPLKATPSTRILSLNISSDQCSDHLESKAKLASKKLVVVTKARQHFTPTHRDSPDGQELFSPEECYDILSHFHTIYMSNLPLIHIRTFGVHRLKFVWPYKPKS